MVDRNIPDNPIDFTSQEVPLDNILNLRRDYFYVGVLTFSFLALTVSIAGVVTEVKKYTDRYRGSYITTLEKYDINRDGFLSSEGRIAFHHDPVRRF